MTRPGRRSGLLALAAAVVVLAGCSAPAPQPDPTLTRPPPSPPRPTGASAAVAAIPWQPSDRTTVLETGLDAPWSVVPLPGGSALISERDSGRIRERVAQGGLRDVGTVPDVVHVGESGLLGLAVQSPSAPKQLYAYLTTANDNRVVRMPLNGAPGGYTIGAPTPVITGLPKAGNHDGG